MEVLTVLFLTIALVGLAVAGMAIAILVKKGGNFPNTHISGNKYLKRNGIYCAQTQDKLEQKKGYKNLKFGKVKLISEDNSVQ